MRASNSICYNKSDMFEDEYITYYQVRHMTGLDAASAMALIKTHGRLHRGRQLISRSTLCRLLGAIDGGGMNGERS